MPFYIARTMETSIFAFIRHLKFLKLKADSDWQGSAAVQLPTKRYFLAMYWNVITIGTCHTQWGLQTSGEGTWLTSTNAESLFKRPIERFERHTSDYEWNRVGLTKKARNGIFWWGSLEIPMVKDGGRSGWKVVPQMTKWLNLFVKSLILSVQVHLNEEGVSQWTI